MPGMEVIHQPRQGKMRDVLESKTWIFFIFQGNSSFVTSLKDLTIFLLTVDKFSLEAKQNEIWFGFHQKNGSSF